MKKLLEIFQYKFPFYFLKKTADCHFRTFRTLGPICFMALACARNLEYRVKNTYKKLSYRRIRDELLSVQVSILKDKSSGKTFCIPSEISEVAYRVYRTVGIKIDTVPFELV